MLYDLGCSRTTARWAVSPPPTRSAIAILYDNNHIFPKWFAYISLWQIVTEVLATQMWVFHSGPFAWNGMITF